MRGGIPVQNDETADFSRLPQRIGGAAACACSCDVLPTEISLTNRKMTHIPAPQALFLGPKIVHINIPEYYTLIDEKFLCLVTRCGCWRRVLGFPIRKFWKCVAIVRIFPVSHRIFLVISGERGKLNTFALWMARSSPARSC